MMTDSFVQWASTVDWQAWATITGAVINSASLAAIAYFGGKSIRNDLRKRNQESKYQISIDTLSTYNKVKNKICIPPVPGFGIDDNTPINIRTANYAFDTLKSIEKDIDDLNRLAALLKIQQMENGSIEAINNLMSEVQRIKLGCIVISQNHLNQNNKPISDAQKEQEEHAFKEIVDPRRREYLEEKFNSLISALTPYYKAD